MGTALPASRVSSSGWIRVILGLALIGTACVAGSAPDTTDLDVVPVEVRIRADSTVLPPACDEEPFKSACVEFRSTVLHHFNGATISAEREERPLTTITSDNRIVYTDSFTYERETHYGVADRFQFTLPGFGDWEMESDIREISTLVFTLQAEYASYRARIQITDERGPDQPLGPVTARVRIVSSPIQTGNES